MDKDVFDELRRIIYTQSGISLSDQKVALLSSRVNKRIRSLSLKSFRDYLNYLKGDPTGRECVHFLDAVSTNTTNFFREAEHFELFSNYMSLWIGQGSRRFRIWSAASSSGEEPYSIAMTAFSSLDLDGLDFKILGTDISTKILAAAQKGLYEEEKLKTVPRQMILSFFTKTATVDGKVFFEISPRIKSMILFKRLNLSSPPFPMKGPLDIVFCRNVMIYFDNAVRERLVAEIFRLLKPGGLMLIGHSESLTGVKNSFHHLQPSVYIKPR